MRVPTLLQSHLQSQVSGLRGTTFQDFIAEVLYKIHGTAGFTTLRDVRDEGCDGILVKEKCVIACYGPDNATFARQKKKISQDYDKYVARWQATQPNWRLYLNLEPSPDHLALAVTLHGSKDVIWGTTRIVKLIEEMRFGLRVEICRELHISEEVVGRDFVKGLLDDLLSQPEPAGTVNYGKLAPDLERKVRANFPAESVARVLALVDLTADQQMDVNEAIGLLSNKDTKILKVRVLSDFNRTSGITFEQRFVALTKDYAMRYNRGDDDEVSGFI